LNNSKSRAIGIKGSEIVDYDLREAMNMKRHWDGSIIDLADILSI